MYKSFFVPHFATTEPAVSPSLVNAEDTGYRRQGHMQRRKVLWYVRENLAAGSYVCVLITPSLLSDLSLSSKWVPSGCLAGSV